VPRHLSPDPQNATHSIFLPEDNIRIPLEMRGVVSLFHTRHPTPEEIETCKWLMFTSEQEWDPHSEDFMCNELALSLTDMAQGRSICTIDTQSPVPHLSETDIILSQISSVYSDPSLNFSLNLKRDFEHTRVIMSQRSSLRKSHITKEELAKLWGISLESANQTLRVMTQKGIRNAIHPIVRRYATKQSRLRYNQLGSRHGRFYSDTFFSNQTSVRGNNMAQLFVNDIKYLRILRHAPSKLVSVIR
jgi:hypothetical protein